MFFTSNLFSQSIAALPSFKEVYIQFFKTYSLLNRPDTVAMQFEKKRDGWHIVKVHRYKPENRYEDEIFFERGAKKFNKLNFPLVKNSAENGSKIKEFDEESLENHCFTVSPYYGYESSDKDVIDDYSLRADLTDTLLYAVGRAYSTLSIKLLRNSAQKFGLPLPKDILEKSLYYNHQSIAFYNKVLEKNPSFVTFVGSIQSKLANEHLTAYYDMCIYASEAEAKIELTNCSYPKYIINSVKEYLISCPENAILFTNGDGDTYPLLYVQEAFNFRKDIQVVNISLLNLPEYFSYIKNIRGLKSSFSDQFSRKLNSNAIYFKNRDTDNKEQQDFQVAVSYLKDSANIVYDEYGERFSLQVNQFRFFPKTDKMLLQFPNTQYILPNEMYILDFIHNNAWNRPICFAISVGSQNLMGLQNFLVKEGFVYTLKKMKNGVSSDNATIKSNCYLNYHLFTKKFIYEDFVSIPECDNNFIFFFRDIAHDCIVEYIASDKLDSAYVIAEKSQNEFPNAAKPYDYYIMPYVELYYKKKLNDKAYSIANIIASNILIDKSMDNKFEKERVLEYKKSQFHYLLYLIEIYDPNRVDSFKKKYLQLN